MMEYLALAFPNIDPIALQFGPIVIRWYALAYIAGIMGGWWYIGWLDGRHSLRPIFTKKHLDDMVVWGVLGVVLGGRIGYVLFYNLPYYINHLADSLKIWHGGMSFHGGALGVIISFYVFSRFYKVPYVAMMDRICCAVPIGLFFGRLANFVNGELYGRVTDVSWAVMFPHGGGMPRHPSQLYEGILEGFVLFLIMFFLATKTNVLARPGILSGVFLVGYGVSRFVVEFVREPDAHIGFVVAQLSMGQLLCIPMVLVGTFLIIRGGKRGDVEV